MLKKCNDSLDGIIRTIARENEIYEFNFVTYNPAEAVSDELDPEDIDYYKLIPVRTRYFNEHKLSEVVEKYCSNEEVLGLASHVWVKIRGGVVLREIVQLDIDCQWPDGNPKLTGKDMPFVTAKQASKLCDMPGYLVHSSTTAGDIQNFHFYGKKVICPSEWKDLMYKVQQDSLVGYIWPAYQLELGYSVLRVSANKDKPHQPKPVLQHA